MECFCVLAVMFTGVHAMLVSSVASAIWIVPYISWKRMGVIVIVLVIKLPFENIHLRALAMDT